MSANRFGGGGDGNSWPLGLSSDGRYALFESQASDLVQGDSNGLADIFLRDVINGTTVLVSATPSGTSGNGQSAATL